MMADKAEYAKKGIAKGRSIVAMEFADGVLLVADNPSASLHKISEMYDRIAFSGAQVQRIRDAAQGRDPARRPQGVHLQPGGRDGQIAGQCLLAKHRKPLQRRSETTRSGAAGRRGGPGRQAQRAVPDLL